MLRAVNKVTYEIAVPGCRSKRKIVHVNRCKQWHPAEASVLRIVVATEEEEEEGKTRLSGRVLEAKQVKELLEILNKYQDVLSDKPGMMKDVEHSINTGNATPIRSLPYRLCPAWREKVREELKKLLEDGITEPSRSPWSSPIVPVKKPDGSLRLCIDFRRVNAVTQPDPYCMPITEDLIQQVGESAYLSKVDLSKGFYQIPLKETDRDKTAFCMPFGKYRFVRMPFGLMGAPATFQRAMDGVLEGQHDYSTVYIDDILVFSASWEEHLVHIAAVLEALRQAGLTAKPSKCHWGVSKLEYLGHVVGEGKVEVPETRVKVLKEFRQPRTKRHMRAFLGTVGYYRKFIQNFADHAYSLTKSTKKMAPRNIVWTEEMLTDFRYLCNVLCQNCLLYIPVSGDKFVLQTDASAKGVGRCGPKIFFL